MGTANVTSLLVSGSCRLWRGTPGPPGLTAAGVHTKLARISKGKGNEGEKGVVEGEKEEKVGGGRLKKKKKRTDT